MYDPSVNWYSDEGLRMGNQIPPSTEFLPNSALHNFCLSHSACTCRDPECGGDTAHEASRPGRDSASGATGKLPAGISCGHAVHTVCRFIKSWMSSRTSRGITRHG